MNYNFEKVGARKLPIIKINSIAVYRTRLLLFVLNDRLPTSKACNMEESAFFKKSLTISLFLVKKTDFLAANEAQ